jgi:hypothetical protein
MRIVLRAASYAFLWPAVALGQAPSVTATGPPQPENNLPISSAPPVFSGTGPTVKASVGYAYLSLGEPSSSRIDLSGLNATVTGDLWQRLGVTADVSYVRASAMLNTGHHADVLSYLGGPIFYPSKHRRLTTYVQGLIGGARVTGVIPFSGTSYLLGYVNRLSWGFGGGAEYRVSASLAIRGGADYLHTYFYDSSEAIRGQDNLRTVVGVVYTLWQHPGRRR